MATLDPVPALRSTCLLDTPSVAVRDVHCPGGCHHPGNEECVASDRLVFPYRGVYVRHIAAECALADTQHVLLFRAGEGYRISHPLRGGDASLVVELSPPVHALLQARGTCSRRRAAVAALRLDARSQRMAATLRHWLWRGGIEPLAAEALALTLAARSLGMSATSGTTASRARQRLADRIKLLLATDPARRWTLAAIATAVGGSPVYLTQMFRQVEGVSLARYQRQLRLAEALQGLARDDDITALAHALGFSSHSHFSATFRQTFGRTPSAYRDDLGAGHAAVHADR